MSAHGKRVTKGKPFLVETANKNIGHDSPIPAFVLTTDLGKEFEYHYPQANIEDNILLFLAQLSEAYQMEKEISRSRPFVWKVPVANSYIRRYGPGADTYSEIRWQMEFIWVIPPCDFIALITP